MTSKHTQLATKPSSEPLRPGHSIVPQDQLYEMINNLEARLLAAASQMQALTYRSHLLENVHDAIIGFDPTFMITYWNRAAEKLYGWSAAEVLGREVNNVLQCGLLGPKRDDVLLQIRQGDQRTIEVEQRGKEGRALDVEVTLMAVNQPDGQLEGYIATVRDISERKQLHQARLEQEKLLAELQQGEARLRDQYAELDQIYRYAPVGMFTFDRDYRFCRINERMAEINGFPVDYHIGRSMDEIVPDLSAFLKEVYRPVLEKGEPVLEVEIHGVTPKSPDIERDWLGSYFPWRSGTGEIIGLIAAVQEVTERKQAEHARHESEERFRWILENTLDLAYRRNLTTDTYDYLSPVVTKLMGLTIEEMQNMSLEEVFDRIHPDDRPGMMEQLALADETGNGRLEYRFRCKDGKYRWFADYITLMKDQQGRPKYRAGMVRDVTDSKAAEEVLKEYALKLEQSNHELQEFAFVASHDLQEPLRKIRAFADNLYTLLGSRLTEAERDRFERLLKASERLQAMIQDLLELSRVNTQGQSFRPVNLPTILEEVVSDLEVRRSLVNGQIHVGHLPAVEADPLQVQRLLTNIIGNSLKYHREGIRPQVKISGEVIKEKDRPWARITVEDNGIGFDMGHVERIFQPFQRLHGRGTYDGNGIGLAICKKIVERHGGMISAHSTPGAGSVFTFTLPATQMH